MRTGATPGLADTGAADAARREAAPASAVPHRSETGPGAPAPASLPCIRMSDDTAWLDATAQAELVRTKEVIAVRAGGRGHRPH